MICACAVGGASVSCEPERRASPDTTTDRGRSEYRSLMANCSRRSSFLRRSASRACTPAACGVVPCSATPRLNLSSTLLQIGHSGEAFCSMLRHTWWYVWPHWYMSTREFSRSLTRARLPSGFLHRWHCASRDANARRSCLTCSLLALCTSAVVREEGKAAGIQRSERHQPNHGYATYILAGVRQSAGCSSRTCKYRAS